METIAAFSDIATLIGEPARAAMLWCLLDGRACTAGELAIAANCTPQSASNHLTRLIAGGLLKVEKQGKHRYYAFSRTEVAYAIEAMASLVPGKTMVQKPAFANGDIQYARTCYDHLAGKIAVALTQFLKQQHFIQVQSDAYLVTRNGAEWFAGWGVNLDEAKQQRRLFAKPCLDWTERKHHVAGALGAAILQQMLANNWIRRKAGSRIVVLTAKGEKAFSHWGIAL